MPESETARQLRELREEVEDLKRWKQHCTIAAAAWGGVCGTILTMGTLIHSYWDSVKEILRTVAK